MFYLLLAILAEVVGTVCIKLSEGYTRPLPSILMFVFYGLSLSFLSFAFRQVDLSVAYAIWGGLGMALIATVGILWFEEPMTSLKLVSFGLIVVGIVGLNVGVEAR